MIDRQMRCREVRPKTGEHVTLCHSYDSYRLPDGLEPGTTARVVGSDYGMLVIEQAGRTWRISDRCIQHVMEYEVGRRWYPKAHPLVQQEEQKEAALRHALASELRLQW